MMNDRAFDAFRICITEGKCTNTDCPYEYECEKVNNGQIQIPKVLALDVMQLLKEQQPLEVVYDINPMTRLPVSFCPKCGEAIQRHEYGRPEMTQLFCSYCGQAVKWEST